MLKTEFVELNMSLCRLLPLRLKLYNFMIQKVDPAEFEFDRTTTGPREILARKHWFEVFGRTLRGEVVSEGDYHHPKAVCPVSIGSSE